MADIPVGAIWGPAGGIVKHHWMAHFKLRSGTYKNSHYNNIFIINFLTQNKTSHLINYILNSALYTIVSLKKFEKYTGFYTVQQIFQDDLASMCIIYAKYIFQIL